MKGLPKHPVRFIIASLAIATPAGLLIGCSEYKDKRGIGDAPMNQVDDQEVKVYPNGDQFPNIAIICTEAGNGIYTTTREAPPVVVTDDPECKL